MKTIKDYKIGCMVVFGKYYSRKCSRRFIELDEKGCCKEATGIIHKAVRAGYVVGIRSVIMSEAKFHGGYTTGSLEGPEYVSGYVKGKRETVLLVTKNIREEPFIVRLCDCQ